MTTFTKEDREAAEKALEQENRQSSADYCGGESSKGAPKPSRELSEERVMQLWEESMMGNARLVKSLITRFARMIEREHGIGKQ